MQMVDLDAQLRPVAHSMRKVGGKLLHFSNRVRFSMLLQHEIVRLHHVVAVMVRGHGIRDSQGGKPGRSPEPPLHLTTLLTGQPKLISIMSNPQSWHTLAASEMTSGSEPNNWQVMGCSSGSKYK